jgi:hypothetical protein
MKKKRTGFTDKRYRKPKWQSRMENLETQATLSARHRTKTELKHKTEN